ncbi:MAG: FIVAR domain-containing protein [Bifidobacteriaceae bacterium]|jgi:beta-galactosidase/beta-glucuronidase|nr:FIVAR domain-containing protein [Bifidobacteriaceae bacterium]
MIHGIPRTPSSQSRKRVYLSAGTAIALAVTIATPALVLTGTAAQAVPGPHNLALHRSVVQTGAQDYNQTGHLITDGIYREPVLPNGTVFPEFAQYNSDGSTQYYRTTTELGDYANDKELALRQWTAKNAFDLRKDTLWQATDVPAWVEIELPAPAVAAGYSLTSAGRVTGLDAEEPTDERAPTDWTLEGSTDGLAYTGLDTQAGQTFAARRSTNDYSFTNTTPYTHYRLTVTAILSTNTTNPINTEPLGPRLAELGLVDASGNSLIPDPLRSRWESDAYQLIPGDPGFPPWVPPTPEVRNAPSAVIDLGGPSSITDVKLYWDNSHWASDYAIDVSADGETWTNTYTTTAGAGGVETIALPSVPDGQQYVRLTMNGDNGDFYYLQEMEVVGENDVDYALPPAPGPGGDGALALTGGNWKLQRASEVGASGGALSRVSYDDSDAAWLPALVPGTVLQSFIAAGAVVDPNFADYQLQISDSYFTADFWYRNEFNIPASQAGKKVWLNLDGINWKADVYVNGIWVKLIEGAFIDTQIDISALAIVGGSNAVAVLIHQNATPGLITEQSAANADPNGGTLGADDPTYHASTGWDWIPTIRGRNIGIWDDVSVTFTDSVRLSNPWVITDLDTDDPDNVDLSSAALTVKSDLYSTAAAPVTVNGTITPPSGGSPITFTSGPINVAPGLNEGTDSKGITLAELTLDNPDLWWPAGYGDQPLYDIELTATVGGNTSDTAAFKFGVRDITYPRGTMYMLDFATFTYQPRYYLQIYVNGARIVCRGGNWGMSDSNVTISAREYDIKMRLHANANLNMVRNWVGQTGDMAFYEAADRHGILIWDDFWLANPVDGPHPDDDAMFLANAIAKVKRARAHASEALWVGRNEGDPPVTLNDPLADITVQYDGTHDYIPNSADFARGTVSGGGFYALQERQAYYDVYFGFLPPSRDMPTLHSERGLPNIPTVDSMKAMLGEDHLWPQDDVWGLHDYARTSAQGLQGWEDFLATHYGTYTDSMGTPEANLTDFVEVSQFAGYEGYQAVFESVYANKTQGMLLWMSQSAWPSMVWQTYDYYYDTNAGYYASKTANQPVNAILDPRDKKIYLSNATIAEFKGTAVVDIFDINGKKTASAMRSLTVPKADLAEAFDLPGSIGLRFVRTSVLDKSGTKIAQDFYWINDTGATGDYSALWNLPDADCQATAWNAGTDGQENVVKVALKNTSGTPMFQAHIKLTDSDGSRILPVYWDDNYVTIMPGETRVLTAQYDPEDVPGSGIGALVEGSNVVASTATLASAAPAADKTALTALAADAAGYPRGEATDADWSAYTAALAGAKAVLADSTATQDRVDSAYSALENVAEFLNIPAKGSTTALAGLATGAGTLVAANYTADSWSALQKALTGAKAVLTEAYPLQPAIDAAFAALQAAILGLKAPAPAPPETPPAAPEISLATATALVGAAQTVRAASFTPASWTAFEAARAAAQAVVANPTSTPAQIDAAVATLLAAWRALAPVKDEDKNVIDVPPGPTSTALKLGQTKLTLVVKKKARIAATTLLSDLSVPKGATWKSSNPKVAKVNAKTGTITAVKVGKAKVTATSKYKSAAGRALTKTITVKVVAKKPAKSKVTSVSASVPKQLKVGGYALVTGKTKPATAVRAKVAYTSSSAKVASISPSGVLIAKAPGTATITVKAGAKSKKYKVTVIAG